MTLGLRGKLFLFSLALSLTVLIPGAFLLRAQEVGTLSLLLVAAIGAVAAAVVLAAAASYFATQSMRDLVDSATAIAEAGGTSRVLERGREIERLVATLATERARSAAVLEGMTDGVVALDQDGRITLFNRTAHALLAAPSDVIGRSLLEVIRAPALADLVRDTPPRASAELEIPATKRRILVHRAPQEAGGTVLVLQDVTALHRLETVRRDFVANVSHELRTPVSIVSANAETLAGGALVDPAVAHTLVEAIHRNASRLTQLINDLLDLSRLEAGKYEIDLESLDLFDATARAIESTREPAAKRRTQVTTTLTPGEVFAVADPDALHQILFNLLENAIKHTPPGSKVTMGAKHRGERVRIEVADNGPGIAAPYHERIFERFYRIDTGRSREMGGTGLGLSIVRHLVEAMGGEAGIGDNHPRGAVFWIELPTETDRPGPTST